MAAGRAKASGGRKAVSATGLDGATVLQKIARDCVAELVAALGSARAGDAETVHRMRVAITRLRSAVAFFAPIAADAQWLRLRREVKWLNASLGAARDNDVMAEYARRKRYRAWAGGEEFGRRGKRDRRRLMRHLRSDRVRRLLAALSGWAERGRWLARWKEAVRRGDAEPLQDYCARELDRWRRRLIRHGQHLSKLNSARRHRLRIRAKRFRYMLEALAEIVGMPRLAELRRMHNAAKRLQRALGDMRDLRRFAKRSASVGKNGKRRPPGYRRQKEKLRSAAVRAGHDLKQAGPR